MKKGGPHLRRRPNAWPSGSDTRWRKPSRARSVTISHTRTSWRTSTGGETDPDGLSPLRCVFGIPKRCEITMNNHTSHPAIEFRDVSLAFDGDVLLDHISFTVPRGE